MECKTLELRRTADSLGFEHIMGVRRVRECAGCGHAEDDTYEFDMPFRKVQPMEAYEPGRAPRTRLHRLRIGKWQADPEPFKPTTGSRAKMAVAAPPSGDVATWTRDAGLLV